jgi:hypothetical protein
MKKHHAPGMGMPAPERHHGSDMPMMNMHDGADKGGMGGKHHHGGH